VVKSRGQIEALADAVRAKANPIAGWPELKRIGDAEPVARKSSRIERINDQAQIAAGFTAHLLPTLHSLGLGDCRMAGPLRSR
jgi:hypothetical protein